MIVMKPKLFIELALSFKAFGLSIQDCGKAFSEYERELDHLYKNLAHRKRCVLIAFAMSQTCSPKKKFILWNLFRNTKL